MSEKELAERIGVKRPYINALSSGKKNATITQSAHTARTTTPTRSASATRAGLISAVNPTIPGQKTRRLPCVGYSDSCIGPIPKP